MRFTVAIPAFKKKYLSECIGSVLSQDYTDFELIIVDDHSPEDIKSVVNTFCDSRIIYYRNNKNCGALNVVDNWNICLSYAKGDFIVLMGDDDFMMPNYLSEFNRLINLYKNVDVFHCRSFQINEKSSIIGITQSWPEYETVYENIWHRVRGYRNQYISDFVYRTSSLRNNGGFYKLPLAWASDDITAYIAAEKCGIVHTQIPVFCYRITNITLSSSGNMDYKMQAIKDEINWISQFINKNNKFEEIDKTVVSLIRNYLPIYEHKKKIETIAYQGLSLKRYFHELFMYVRKRKTYGLTLSELAYAFLLSRKMYKSR